MLRFFLDENVTERLVNALADQGIDAISANRDHKGSDDATLLLVATELRRVLVTYNVSHFALLHRAWIAWSTAWDLDPPRSHAGIMLIHPAPSFGYERMANEISAFATNLGQTTVLENRAYAWNSIQRWHEL